MAILPCSISVCCFKYCIAVNISAIPALSSAPSSVIPSEVIIVCPLCWSNEGNSKGESVVFAFKTMSFPS